MAWVHADASSKRLDEKYLVRQRVQMPLSHLASVLSQVRAVFVLGRLRFCLTSCFRFCLTACLGLCLTSLLVVGKTHFSSLVRLRVVLR